MRNYRAPKTARKIPVETIKKFYGESQIAFGGAEAQVLEVESKRPSRMPAPKTRIERLLALSRAERLALVCTPTGELNAAEHQALLQSL
jgi:hypothetical protein